MHERAAGEVAELLHLERAQGGVAGDEALHVVEVAADVDGHPLVPQLTIGLQPVLAHRRSVSWSACASSRGTSAAAPVAATSGNPPTSVTTSGTPKPSAVKRTPDWSISRYGSTARSARRKSAPASPSLTKRSTNRTPGGAAARSGPVSMRGAPTTHSSAPAIPRHASSSTSSPLYGRSSPKNRTTGPATPASSGGSSPSPELVRTPCGITSTLAGSTPSASTSRPRPWSECTTTAST